MGMPFYMEKRRQMKKIIQNILSSFLVSALLLTSTTFTTEVSASSNRDALNQYQRLIISEGAKMAPNTSYHLSGKWYSNSGGKAGYSTSKLVTECNGFVRRILVNALIKSKEQGVVLDKAYDRLLNITGDGLDLRGVLMQIQNAEGQKTLTVPRNLTNSDYSPNTKAVDAYMDKLGAGAVVHFVKNKGQADMGYHWGIYTGKINGKHMVLHNSTASGGIHEEFNSMWFGKGSGYVFDTVYTPFDPIPELGGVSIEKVGTSDEPISGVSFSLYKEDKKTLVKDKLITDVHGKISVDNLEPEIYYAIETYSPNPYILDGDTWYRFDVKPGKISKVAINGGKITNEKATGVIRVTKRGEDGKLYAGVGYQIHNNEGSHVDTITTGKDGVASSKKLPLGKYTVKEVSAPKELQIDSSVKTVSLNYKDQYSKVVYGDLNTVNKYYASIDLGVEKIRIDTKKAKDGLKVETWFNIKENYDPKLNDFKESVVKLLLVDESTGGLVDSKNVRVKDLTNHYVFNVPSSKLKVGSNTTYEIVIEADKSKVNVVQEKVSTSGYTAKETKVHKHVDDQNKFSFKEVIRTERTYGQNMVTYYEHFDMSVDLIQPLRTGRGFTYDVKTEYRNDLKNTANIEFVFSPDPLLVDKDYGKMVNLRNPKFKLENKNGTYVLPHIYAEERSGKIISVDEYNKLSASMKKRYLDGGHQLLTPVWSTDPGKYDTQLTSNEVGVNAIQYTVDDYADVFAYMFAWYDENGQSPTHEMDGIAAAPVMAHNPFPNGIPGNWGYTLSNGKKALTAKEMEFFGMDQRMAVRFMIDEDKEFNQSIQVEKGATITVTDKVPSKPGYRFMGWEMGNSDFKAGDKVQAVTDLWFFAKWEASDFRVTFNTNGGTSINPIDFSYGDLLKAPQAPAKEGYDFMGWDYNFNNPLYKNTTVKALWKIKEVAVAFDADGGTSISKINLNWGSTLEEVPLPVKDGSTFVSWNYDFSKPFYEDTLITAEWEDSYYDVYFDTDGGNTIESQKVKHGDKILVPKVPVKTGETFLQWEGPSLNSAVTNTITYRAVWAKTNYTVKFNTGGGTKIPDQVLTYNEFVKEVDMPSRKGYEFNRWGFDFTTAITDDLVINAIWDVERFLVEFDTKTEDLIPFQLIEYGGKATPPPAPVKEGYTFVKWSFDFDTPVYSNILMDAVWEANTYQVNYHSNSGVGSMTSDSVKYDSFFGAKKNAFTRIGHTFTGWNEKANGSGVPWSENPIGNWKWNYLNDITLYAQWKLNSYQVNFNLAGGIGSIANQTISHGSKAIVPTIPTRTGYTFNGWSPAIGTTITEPSTFTAQWVLNKYTVLFNSNGGSAVANQSVNHGSKATVPANPTRTGYAFTGWSPAIGTVITGNRTFTAQWTINKYTVSFNSNAGSAVASQTVNYGSKVTVPKNPTRTGYTFTGWSPAIGTTITGPRTFTAQWSLNKYTVSFNSDGGTSIPSQTVSHGSKVTVPKNPTLAGYTFKGWSPNINNSITGNTTFKAQWESLPITNKYGYVQGSLSDGNLFQVYYTETYRGPVFLYIDAEVIIQKVKSAGSISGHANWSVTMAGNTYTGSKSYSMPNGQTGFSNLGWITIYPSDIKGSANYSVQGTVSTSTLGSVTTNTGYKP